MSKKHFIIIEVETEKDQTAKATEDMVISYLRIAQADKPPQAGFTLKSVGWIADKVREAPTGRQVV